MLPLAILSLGIVMSSCKKEEMEEPTPTTAMQSASYDYEFNNGQVVPTAAYSGTHNDNFSATIEVDEISATQSMITVTLNNTISGQTYNIHAHDAADPTMTPNGTPYNEVPNATVFVQTVDGNGGSVSVSQTVNMSFSELTTSYEGFFVIHDPLQMMSTTDISTYLVVGTFARAQAATNLSAASFAYDFNTGQLDASYAYNGMHANTLSGNLMIQELADGTSRVSVQLNGTMSGQTYHVHAHDAADPTTTPNGTPYDESPNTGLLTMMINGNGGMAMGSQMSAMSFSEITSNYAGFFVVHDPLQPIDTTNPASYVLLGLFAQ